MSEGLFWKQSDLEEYKADANEAITFKLVRGDGKDEDFKPAMTHQIFGEAECIFGYRGLSVELWLSACALNTCVKVHYTHKISQDGVQADDILVMLEDKLEVALSQDEEAFTAKLSCDHSFHPSGSLLHSYTGDDNRSYHIYHTETATDHFLEWHQKLQGLLLFFVDAASFIDSHDTKWHYFTLHEKFVSVATGTEAYAFVGYMTVYDYYAYPDKIRPRISQMLILPPWQGKRHGSTLLQTFYNWALLQPHVLDIAVEDPSEDFQRMRDLTDCMNTSNIIPSLSDCLGRKSVMEVRRKLKLSKKQTQRVLEILELRNVEEEEDFKDYKNNIKKRLNQPLQKNSRHFERLSSSLRPDELSAAMNSFSTEQRLVYLEQQSQLLITQYRHVLNKM